jgi:8-oxo-dGTP pyrophosphatase MutT (NUDIX family)
MTPVQTAADKPIDKTAIRDAATVILHREGREGPEVLMGQRGAMAAFMPNKFVFPGGAVDAEDAAVPLAAQAADETMRRLALHAAPHIPRACLAAAIREVWEETGLVLGRPGSWHPPAPDWDSFAATGHAPDASALSYVFRAITPPGRPRRFDARFLLAPATAIQGDPDDFTHACDELSHLQWVPLARARSFDLPFITEVVLAEIGPLIHEGGTPATVPFVENDDPISSVRRLA